MKKMEVSSLIQRLVFLENRKLKVDAVIREVLEKNLVGLQWAPYQATKVQIDVKESQTLQGAIERERVSLAKTRGELGRLAMRRKSLETLREKRKSEFKIDESRKIQREIDEAFRLIQPGADLSAAED